jgi:DeoR/GlpR family transcriptional regulator of sugar metabolism
MEKKPVSLQPLPLRREAIYQLIKEEGVARVNDLSERLGVTCMTIRRDLETLERDGLVERVHGGAVATNRGVSEPLYTQKSILHKQEKDAIALAASHMVDDGDTLFINSGSTTLRLFKTIKAKRVKIITNNACFPMEDMSPGIDIISTGGMFRRESFTLVGDAASRTVEEVYADKSFLGLDGFDLEHGITTPVQEEAQINRMMIEHTKGEVIIVADSSKIGHVSAFFVAKSEVVSCLVTDSGIPAETKELLEKAGIKVMVC